MHRSVVLDPVGFPTGYYRNLYCDPAYCILFTAYNCSDINLSIIVVSG